MRLRLTTRQAQFFHSFCYFAPFGLTKMAPLLNPRKVLITDKIDEVCKSVLQQHGLEVTLKPGMPKEDLLKEIKNYDCLIVRSATKVTEEVIKAGEKLQIIGRAGTGVDNIDIAAASKNGIFVMNTPGGNTLSAAEHTCALIAAMARNIPQGFASMKEGKWERSKLMGCELNGKTLAILGLGRIGKEVALRMQSYGMKTIGFDPIVSKEDAASFGVESLSLEEIWPQADFITVHTPLIPQTKGLLSKGTFAKCKDGLRVVNVARGGIIDEADLIDALDSGKVAGAALDVFVSEPPSDISSKLAMHPKVLCTPHLGASTVEAQKRVAKEIAEQIVDASQGKSIIGLVNAPFLTDAGKEEFKCWLELSKRLARLLHAIVKSPTMIQIKAQGDALKAAGGLISAGVALGIVQQSNKDANLINSVEMLTKNGVQIKWIHTEGENGNHLTVAVSLEKDPMVKLGGTVFGAKSFLLTHYNGGPLSGPVSLETNAFVYHVNSPNAVAFFKAVAENSIPITSFAYAPYGDRIFGTLKSQKEEKLPEDFVSVLF